MPQMQLLFFGHKLRRMCDVQPVSAPPWSVDCIRYGLSAECVSAAARCVCLE